MKWSQNTPIMVAVVVKILENSQTLRVGIDLSPTAL